MRRCFILQLLLLCIYLLSGALPATAKKAKRLKVVEFRLAEGYDQATIRRLPAKKFCLDGDSLDCPIIMVRFNEEGAVFEGQVLTGDVPEFKTNEYWVYMQPRAKHLIVKHKDYKLKDIHFKDYSTKEDTIKELTSKVAYYLELEEEDEDMPSSSFIVSAGFNAMPFTGPSASVGVMFSNFSVEAGAVFGLGKSSDVYIYDKASTLADGYNYSAMRGFLRIGYDFWLGKASSLKRVFAITPQIGAAFNSVRGKRLSEVSTTDKVLDGATAISGTAGIRLMFAPSGPGGAFRVFLTPEYDFAASKDKNFEALSKFDSTIKGWADGLNVNLGLMFYF